MSNGEKRGNESSTRLLDSSKDEERNEYQFTPIKRRKTPPLHLKFKIENKDHIVFLVERFMKMNEKMSLQDGIDPNFKSNDESNDWEELFLVFKEFEENDRNEHFQEWNSIELNLFDKKTIQNKCYSGSNWSV